eukprot:5616502-Amphidinium_carterae.1
MANVASSDGGSDNFNVFNAIKATVRPHHCVRVILLACIRMCFDQSVLWQPALLKSQYCLVKNDVQARHGLLKSPHRPAVVWNMGG